MPPELRALETIAVGIARAGAQNWEEEGEKTLGTKRKMEGETGTDGRARRNGHEKF